MAVNTLFRTGEQSPWVYRGHDTEALGPSDSSDSGSDMQGLGGAFEAAELGLDPSVIDEKLSRRVAHRAYEPSNDPDATVINYPKK
jgi:hypothetical protein